MYSDTVEDVFKKLLSCSGSVSRTGPLGTSPLLKRGQWQSGGSALIVLCIFDMPLTHKTLLKSSRLVI